MNLRAAPSLRSRLALLVSTLLGLLLAPPAPAAALQDRPVGSGLVTLADSIRNRILAGDVLRAPAMARRHLAALESRPDVDRAALFEALGFVAESQFELRPRPDAEIESAFTRMRALADDTAAGRRRRASLARLEAARHHAAARFDSSNLGILVADSLFRDLGATDVPEYAAVLKHRALTLRGGRRMADAERALAQAAEILEARCGVESDSLWDVLGYRASNFLGPGGPARSLALHVRAVDMQRRLLGPDAPRLAQTLYNLGVVQIGLGMFDAASRSAEEALAIVGSFGGALPRWKLGVLLNLRAMSLYETGRFAEAETTYLRSISETSAELGADHANLVFPLGNLAALRVDQGRVAEARADVDRLGVLLRASADSTGPLALDQLDLSARLALQVGDSARAREWVTRRLAREARTSNPSARAGVPALLLRGWWAWLAGDPRRALLDGLEAERVSRDLTLAQAMSLSDEDARSFKEDASEGLNLALMTLTDPALLAEDRARAFDSLIRSRGFVLGAMLARRRDLLSSVDPETQSILDRLAKLRTLRANAAMTTTGATASESGLSFLERERLLLGELESREPTLSRLGRTPLAGLDEVSASLPVGDALVSYVRFEGRDEPCGSARDLGRRSDHYGAFVLPGPGQAIHYLDLGPAAALDSLVAAWRALVARRAPPGDPAARRRDEAGEELRRRILEPPLAATGSAKRVHVVPDGSLALVPFDMLPDTSSRLVVERDVELRFQSSERDLLADTSGAATHARGVLALGGVDFEIASAPGAVAQESNASTNVSLASLDAWLDAAAAAPPLPPRFDPTLCAGEGRRRFAPLPQSGIEAREVGSLARQAGLEAGVLVGAEASEPAFKQQAPGRAFVHVASHGFWLADSCRAAERAGGSGMLRSGLVLAGANAGIPDPQSGEDGILTAEEIAGLDLRGLRVAVLSACESGVGEGVDWEGVVGLRRAFQTAGAASLVTSLWPVDDLWARAWMREFYSDLFRGSRDAGTAGRRATRALVARQRAAGREPDPFTCGAFVVTAR